MLLDAEDGSESKGSEPVSIQNILMVLMIKDKNY